MNTTDAALDPTLEPDVRTLVALTPADIAATQTELLTWCDRKIAEVRCEVSDLETNLELATEHGWKHQSVAATLARARKRVVYYEKVKAAVAAGYLIVPNFPVDVFAVRVARQKQREQTSTYAYNRHYKTAKAELLPAGEGRYVDDVLYTRDESFTEDLGNGKTKEIAKFVSDAYDEVDFPIVMAKPVVMEATGRAMALKLFDEMGLVQNQGGRDPIVVGRLVDPRGNGRCTTFFVAWWLDVATL